MSDTLLGELAAAAGILPSYWDLAGELHPCTPDTARALLKAMGYAADSAGDIADSLQMITHAAARWLPEATVLRLGSGPLRVGSSESSAPVHWTLTEENGVVHTGRADSGDGILVPDDLPPGYHQLTLEAGARQAAGLIIAAPPSCFSPGWLTAGDRLWGTACHLYSLRSRRDWGIGDFTDLATLSEMTGKAGGAAVAINPLHALFPARPELCSPYWPSSRLFLNPLYLDLSAIPELKDCAEARDMLRDPRLPERIAAVKTDTTVDYRAVMRLKCDLLRPLVRRWEEHPWPELDAFAAAGGPALQQFAAFCALSDHFGGKPWPSWPTAFQDPASANVARWVEAHRRDVKFHVLLQGLAARQFEAAAGSPTLAIGLLRDLAVGVSPDGADAWTDQSLYPRGTRFGAPPDMFSTTGQDWGLPPPNPRALTASGYAPFIAAMRSNMAHAGALRIDHVMALDRLFWIPEGATALDGAYVRYPFNDLLGVLALESHRARCLMIGEDLGTVPDGFRDRMSQENILSTRVFFFERHDSKLFKRPDQYPAHALAQASTHDTPTLAGYWQGRDLAVRAEIAPDYPLAEESTERAVDRDRIVAALADQDFIAAGENPAIGDIVLAIHRFLARTPAQLMLVNIADVMAAVEQLNLPGTVDEHPNWRLKLPMTLEDLSDSAAWVETTRAVAAERR